MAIRFLTAAALIAVPLTSLADEHDAEISYRWLSETEDILAEGIIWNDSFGDGKDRYKTGGVTQSWLMPESLFSDGRWFDGQASALEFQARAFVASPNNTSRAQANDRPFAQYAAVGAYLRTSSAPRILTPSTALTVEDRIGVEVGLQGDPLPLYEIQDSIHGATGGGRIVRTRANTLRTEVLLNAEGRRTWRLHHEMGRRDLQVAPYVHGSVGMREISVRAGADVILGSSLEARTWNSDPAIGALIPGGSAPRDGWQWMTWIGGDVGLVGADAFLDGGFRGNGPKVSRRPVTGRVRGGLMLEYEDWALSYSVTWLSPEFRQQPAGQFVGAVQLKYRF